MISLLACTSFRLAATLLSAACVCSAQQPAGFVSGFQPNPDVASAPRSSPAPQTVGTPQISKELRGDIYMARKMYREAIDMYREVSPDSAVIANKIGIAFHQLSLLDLARKNYQRAIKLNPDYSEAINNLGTIFYSQKNYRRSISLYKRALKVAPSSASIYSNLGAAYFGRKDYKMATAYYQQALQLDPDVFEHHSNYGTLMQERDVEERATYHLYMAKMYAQNGSTERALIYLRKALEEGVKDRNKIPAMPEFASLKKDPAFAQLIADNPKPL
jgi:tetratricopeptide (TPR) repeat protein